ncbi:Putative multidrug resistance protein [Linum perenne]
MVGNGKGGLFRHKDWVDMVLMVFGTLGSIGDGSMTPLTMYILSSVINEYGGSQLDGSNSTVDKYALRLLFLSILVGASAFLEGLCWTRTAERQTSRMRINYLQAVLRQEVGFFDEESSSSSSSTFQVISVISSDAHLIQDTIAEKIPNCLAHLTSFVASILVSFLLSWELAISALPFAIMFIAPGLGFGKLLMKLGGKSKEAYEVAGGICEQAISSIRVVYSYVGEFQTLERFSNALQRSLEIGIRQGLTKGLLIGSMGMIYGAWAFQAWVGSYLVSEKGQKGGAVFISGACVIIGGVSIMNALPNLSFISQAVMAASRINEMVERVPSIDSEDENKKVLARVKGNIEFQDVHFSYPSRLDSLVLNGFSLRICHGETVALVGGSGSGKSTVIALLERFYDPVKGSIFLDGYDIKKLQPKWLRSQMGLVNQEPILFATTIHENILFGNEEASEKHVEKAAMAANIHDFIIKLPNGYQTQVGQFGFQLSGGQKQRIAIARALIRNPKILLLDEATSALDAESEKVVQSALDKASVGRTTIIVAHRLETVRKADLIVVLQSGSIVESGSHDELIEVNSGSGGAYYKMLRLQQSSDQKSGSNASNRQSLDHGLNRIIMSPRSPVSETSSCQGSPYAFSPVFSMNIETPVQTSIHHQDDKNKNSSSSHQASQWRLLRMNAPEWKRGLLGCLGSAVVGAIQPAHAFSLGSVLSVYFSDDNSYIKSETITYCFLFISFSVLSFTFNIVQHYNFAIMGEKLVKRVREKMVEQMLTFEIGWFDQEENTSAAICAQLANEAQLVRSLVGDRMSLLIQICFSASIAFVVSLVVTWRLSIVIIVIQPLIIGSFYSRSMLMKKMSEKARSEQREGIQLASEAIVNHRTITAFSSQSRILGLFAQTMEGPKKEIVKQSWISGFGMCCSQFLTTASMALTYWYGGRLLNQRLISPKHLFQAFFLLMSTGKNIADAGSMSSDIAKGGDAIRSVFETLDRNTEIDPDDTNGIEVRKQVKGKIELDKIFFTYPARPDQAIFRDLSLTIEAGKTIALVGPSGSGKSTILGLIERFYDPQRGTVLVDERDIRSYNLRDLRSYIGLVSQEPTLFAGTIRDNIAYGNASATEAEIRKAAIQANAHQFISTLKEGYDTNCGERGMQLSGGQKQRIALARAMLKNPAILLLDEATSALDSISENLVQEALEKMMVDRTCVVVAHRLATIEKADVVAVIKNGKIAEEGSHRNLIALHGIYYSLVKAQGGHSPYR